MTTATNTKGSTKAVETKAVIKPRLGDHLEYTAMNGDTATYIALGDVKTKIPGTEDHVIVGAAIRTDVVDAVIRNDAGLVRQTFVDAMQAGTIDSKLKKNLAVGLVLLWTDRDEIEAAVRAAYRIGMVGGDLADINASVTALCKPRTFPLSNFRLLAAKLREV